MLSLTEICLKPDEYIISNKSTTQDYCSKNEPRPKGKGRGVATIYSNIFSISQKTGFKHNSLKLGVGDMVTPRGRYGKRYTHFTKLRGVQANFAQKASTKPTLPG